MSYTPRKQLTELASSPETSSKAVESSWDINLPNSKNTGLLIKNRKLTCTDARTKKWPSKLTISLEGKSYITSISIIKQKISWKNGTGSGFGHKIGRDGGIEKKKRRESGIWEPLLWTLLNLPDKMDFWAFLHAIVWNLVHFFTKFELFVFIVQFLGHFCTCLVNDKD